MLLLRARGINTCIPIKQLNETYIWEINAPEGKQYALLFEEVKNDNTVNIVFHKFGHSKSLSWMNK